MMFYKNFTTCLTFSDQMSGFSANNLLTAFFIKYNRKDERSGGMKVVVLKAPAGLRGILRFIFKI